MFSHFKNSLYHDNNDYQSINPNIIKNTFYPELNHKQYFKDNIVYDLDNTLVCAIPFSQLHLIPSDLPFFYYDFIVDKTDNNQNVRIFARPYLHKMLLSVSKFANISIWTAAGKNYAEFVVSKFFPTSIKIDFLFHSEQVQDAVRTYFRFKPLDYIYSFFPNYTKINTIIVDDLTDVASANPNNSIQIKAFKLLTDMLNTFNKSVLNDTELLKLIEELKIKFDTLLFIDKMDKLKI